MKILFPTDFSLAAENGFIYALKLAEKLRASVTVVHVYAVLEVHTWIEESMDMGEINNKITLGEFERFKDEIEVLKRLAIDNALSEIEVNYSLKESDHAVEAILQEAGESNVDIIVVGTTGAKGLKELFFGSIASRVMEKADRPVVVVPSSARFKGLRKLGLTLDYKTGELELIEKSLSIARRLSAELHCLHVDVHDPENVKSKYFEYKEAFKHDPDLHLHVHHDMNIEKGILEFMKANQVDAVLMRVHHRNLINEVFSYSIAKRISYHSEIPLIALHVAEKK